MVFQNDILAGASGSIPTYQIDQSIRFNDNDTASLYKTFASAGDRRTWTLSLWFKRGNLTRGAIFSAGTSNSNIIRLQLQTTNVLNAGDLVVPTDFLNWNSDAVYRDTSAWYHVVFRWDTTQATAADRFRVYINGIQQTPDPSTIPAQNYEGRVNQAVKHEFGRSSMGTDYIYDGYMAEINFIDGQALAPTDFGETNDDGVWIPKAYAGSYGTNGFYITGATAGDLGEDFSGNNNDFTSSGLATDDQRGDTPTANHATWNPLFFRRTGSYKPTFADGNLYVAGQGSQVSHTGTTIASTGKHYAEFLVNNGSSTITGPGVVRTLWDGGLAESYASNFGGSYYGDNGGRYYNATSDSQTAPGSNRVGIEVDFANDEVEYFIVTSGGTKTSQGGKLTSSDGIAFDGEGIFTATLHDSASRNITAYFEEADWYGTPNTGYVALNTANFPTPAITDGSAYFQTTTYTGAGYPTEVNQSDNSTFQPDFVWVKRRNGATTHNLFDAVRGVSSQLYSNLTNAEGTVSNAISFDADGFTAAADPITGDTGSSSNTFVGWQWLAGNGTASNGNGSIASTVSANTTAGFSIVSYTGNATGGATIGHGLSQAPEMVITKSRDNGTGRNWAVYHVVPGPTKYGELDNTNTFNTGSTRWNDTAPSSTVVTLGSQQTTNDSGAAMIAYCWYGVEGFSKFGSFKGNNSLDGPFIYTGFKPAFVMAKRSDSTSDWFILDAQRPAYNVIGGGGVGQLPANLTYAESSLSTYAIADFLSNGFKVRHNMTYGYWNVSAANYIYMAFAEHPFGGEDVAPATAR